MTSSSPPHLLRVPGASLHRQIHLVLREAIYNKTWRPGTAPPDGGGTGAKLTVSRVTVRRAHTDLAASGLVECRRGVGAYVRSDVLVGRPSATLVMVEELRLSGAQAQVKVIDLSREMPSAGVARLLGLPEGVQRHTCSTCGTSEASQ